MPAPPHASCSALEILTVNRTTLQPCFCPGVVWHRLTLCAQAAATAGLWYCCVARVISDVAVLLLSCGCCCQANLYSLVWRRAMASQMQAAELEQVRAGTFHPAHSCCPRCVVGVFGVASYLHTAAARSARCGC